MVTLAALVIGSALTAAGAVDAPSAEPAPAPPIVTPLEQRREQRRELRRHRMATIHTVAGIGLEVGAGLFHVLTATTFIGHDLSCAPSDSRCNMGTPIVLFLPAGAIAMGWVGATRLAAGREASIWRSPVFWAGTGVTVATLVIPTVLGAALNSPTDQPSQNARVAWDIALVTGFVLGNVIQVWGAYTAPPRDVPAGTRALNLAPGCGPTSGGIVCGLALAGF